MITFNTALSHRPASVLIEIGLHENWKKWWVNACMMLFRVQSFIGYTKGYPLYLSTKIR